MTVLIKTLGVLLATLPYYTLVLSLTYGVIYATYQAFLHPLSKYPGPWLAKFTDAHSGFYAYKKRIHLETRQSQLRYGPVIRQGPNKLVFSSVSALQEIYKNDRITKTKSYTALGPGMPVPNIFTAADRHFHRSRRQLIGQVLTDRSLHLFEPVIDERINIFLSQLLKSAELCHPIDLSESVRRLTIDIAGLLGFGFDLNLQRSDDKLTTQATGNTLTGHLTPPY